MWEEEVLEDGQVDLPTWHGRRRREQTTFPGLLVMAEAAEEEAEAIAEAVPMFLPEREEREGTLWTYLHEQKAFYEVTNFSEDTLRDIYQDMIPVLRRHCRHGPLPQLMGQDGLIVILAFYKTAASTIELAHQLGQKLNTLKDNINRLCPIVLEVLKSM
jgi:hypothetical protein